MCKFKKVTRLIQNVKTKSQRLLSLSVAQGQTESTAEKASFAAIILKNKQKTARGTQGNMRQQGKHFPNLKFKLQTFNLLTLVSPHIT